ncbi:MAG: class I SAM-dependent methyltransferase [Candidatus Nomurabacteria bacterium]|jgi:hypothetical protein|nr:class I SAM-dependent methyltransferase [Candidatus Nomurabacteria bacterium]
MQPKMDDPNLPPMNRDAYADKYTDIHQRWQNGQVPPSQDDQQKVQADLDQTYGTQLSSTVMEQLAKKGVFENPALTQFLIDFGAKSRAFMSALLVAPAISILRTASGETVFGEPIHELDPFWWWPLREPMFISARFRSHIVAEHFRNQNAVAILGIGYAPELRILEKDPDSVPSVITACDLDPEVISWCSDFATTPAMQGRLDVKQSDLLNTLLELPNESQDSISMIGLASYCVEKLPKILQLIFTKLKPDGTLIIDLQILEWSLKRCIDVFGWQLPGFAPSSTVEQAVRTMEEASQALPLSNASYYIDPRIGVPIGVVFVLRK